jgi:hypothetical protein
MALPSAAKRGVPEIANMALFAKQQDMKSNQTASLCYDQHIDNNYMKTKQQLCEIAFRDGTPCNLAERYQCFRGTCSPPPYDST